MSLLFSAPSEAVSYTHLDVYKRQGLCIYVTLPYEPRNATTTERTGPTEEPDIQLLSGSFYWGLVNGIIRHLHIILNHVTLLIVDQNKWI